jgi:hypothetical protein
MFGHQRDDLSDTSPKDNAPADAIVAPDNPVVISATTPAVEPSGAPTVNKNSTTPTSTASSFIATDSSGQPSADLPAPAVEDADLLNIKQQALQQLGPLVGHLDQTPEEKFRTTMMMIQASDDQSLVKAAYDAAQAITDERTRAQALLDIVNEINYFTQNPDA